MGIARQVDLQVLRCLASYADEDALNDLQRLMESPEPAERRAAALCLCESPHPRAAQLRAELPVEVTLARSGALTWNRLAPKRSRTQL